MVRPNSKKARALASAYANRFSNLEQVVLHFAAQPLTYKEVAQLWSIAVQIAHPKLALVPFNEVDVHRYYKRFRVQRLSIQPGVGE